MKYAALVTLIVACLLAACSGSRDDESPTGESQDTFLPVVPNDGAGDNDAASPTLPAGYPAPPTVTSAYPAPSVPTATPDPYPGGKLIMVKAMGEQCAQEPDYQSAEEAIEELEAIGITVLGYEEVSLPVCAACGCPTSEHIRVELKPADLPYAESLGWRRE